MNAVTARGWASVDRGNYETAHAGPRRPRWWRTTGGCAGLNFLKGPTVPRERGDLTVDLGPAFAPAASAVGSATTATDWLTYNGTLTGERWAALDEIDRRTVSGLRPVCRFRTGERVPMQSGPVVIGETVYFTSARHTWAVDASTCSLRWAARYDYRPAPPFDLRVNRGVAYLDGKLFRGANDGRVYALDALTGRELWNVRAADSKRGETFPAADCGPSRSCLAPVPTLRAGRRRAKWCRVVVAPPGPVTRWIRWPV